MPFLLPFYDQRGTDYLSGRGYVEKVLPFRGGHKDRCCSQELLQPVQGQLGLVGPNKMITLS